MAILTEVKDPRVKNVTVTGVEVAPDMRTAKVFVSVMGDETARRLSLRGLQNSAGFLQSLIAKRIDTRYTPRLTFVFDDGVQKSAAVARILQDWRNEPRPGQDLDQPESDARDAHLQRSASEDTGGEDVGALDSDATSVHETPVHETPSSAEDAPPRNAASSAEDDAISRP